MNIEGLSREKGSASATITLNYDEIRCICNSLYALSHIESAEKEKNFNQVRAMFIELFALVKHGMIPDFEIKCMYDLLFEKNGSSEEKAVEK